MLIKPNFYGFYALTFGSQGCVTEPLQILTEFDPYTLEILEQPSLNYDLKNLTNMTEIRNTYQRNGDFLPKVLIYLSIKYYIKY